jgi:uncharacterized protein YqjF (DUF2071 family)
MPFLTAEWRKLAMANYAVDPELLAPYVPAGTELDLWQDTCYVSLVGFMFRNVRLLGFKIPFHVHFPEVNLRFYVRRREDGDWKRGVVFISEIVPKPALTIVANAVYKEHYETLPMRHQWEEAPDQLRVTYEWKKGGAWHHFRVDAAPGSIPIERGSETEFITEHFWGYARINDRRTNEYEVTHPTWEAYPVRGYQVDVNFGKVYGKDFDFLTNREPESVLLAEGSPITVESRRKLFLE